VRNPHAMLKSEESMIVVNVLVNLFVALGHGWGRL
jgi:hypothetical protein